MFSEFEQNIIKKVKDDILKYPFKNIATFDFKEKDNVCYIYDENNGTVVIIKDNIWYSFSSGESGNIVDLTLNNTHFTEIEILKKLCDKLKIINEDFNKIYIKFLSYRDRLFQLNDIANEFFKDNLKNSKIAQSYLNTRQLSESDIERFGIGYAKGYNSLLKILEDKFEKELLYESSLIIENKNNSNPKDFFANRVTFPIYRYSKIVGFGARAIQKAESVKYLNIKENILFKKEKTLYNIDSIIALCNKLQRKLKYLIAVEGFMDSISLASKNIPCVSTLGVNLSYYNYVKLKSLTDELIVCYDDDNAGESGAVRTLNLPKVDDFIKITFLKEGLDPDEFIHKYSPKEFMEYVHSNKLNRTDYILSKNKDKLNEKNIFDFFLTV